MIRYILKEKKNSFSDETLYFAKAVHLSKMTTTRLMEKIERNCGLKKSDVIAVLAELADCMKESIANGEDIQLDGIGHFKTEIRSEGVKNPQDFKSKHIKGVKINFTPESANGRQMLIDGLEFCKMK